MSLIVLTRRSPISALTKLTFTLFILFNFSGCTLREMAYRNADWLILKRFNKMFDLRDDQEGPLELAISKNMDTIHTGLRPDLVAKLKELRKRLDDGLDENDMNLLRDDYILFRKLFFAQIADDLANFSLTLSDEQLAYFAKTQDERNKQFTELLALPEDKIKKKLLAQQVHRLEEWVGDLSDEQQAEVAKIYDFSLAKLQTHYQVTQGFQKSVRNLFAEAKDKKDAPAIAKKIREWGAAPDLMLEDSLRPPYLLRWEKEGYNVYLVSQILTPKQKASFLENFDDLIEDLDGMPRKVNSVKN